MSDHFVDHWFAYGFKTEAAAQEGIEKAIADGELSQAEHPRVEKYPVLDGRGFEFRRWRYGIKVTI